MTLWQEGQVLQMFLSALLVQVSSQPVLASLGRKQHLAVYSGQVPFLSLK